MYCTRCGDLQVEGSRFCKNCGAPLEGGGAVPAAPSPPPPPAAAGRGPAILTLGILSLVMLGFLTGIPAWVMGHRDLKRIRAGEIAGREESFTKAGMIMGIVGTCISIVTILFLVFFLAAMFRHGRWMRPYRVESTRNRMLAELRMIADDAVTYRATQAAVTGKETFVGYEIPARLRSTSTAEYGQEDATSVVITLYGTSHDGTSTVTAAVDADGKLTQIHFGGGAEEAPGEDARGAEPRAPPLPLPA